MLAFYRLNLGGSSWEPLRPLLDLVWQFNPSASVWLIDGNWFLQVIDGSFDVPARTAIADAGFEVLDYFENFKNGTALNDHLYSQRRTAARKVRAT